jgi:hypothetical protein
VTLLLLVDILVDFSEISLSNVVGGINYDTLVQIYWLTATIYNGILWNQQPDHIFEHFLSKKIFENFVSIVYLNSFLFNVVVPLEIHFLFSSVSC